MCPTLRIVVSVWLWLLSPALSWGQTVLNGSFEQHGIDSCGINLPNLRATELVPHLFAFGQESELDILSEACGYGPAQEGTYYLALNGDAFVDAACLALSDTLRPGRRYAVQFFQKFGELPFSSAGVEIGVSLLPDEFGELVFQAEPAGSSWRRQVAEFQLSRPAAYLSIRARPGVRSWVFVDDFAFICPSGPELGRDTTLCQVLPRTLEAGLGYERYRWQDGSTAPSLKVDGPGQYWVEVEVGACRLGDSLWLAEHPTQCRCPVFSPTAFTPNGDGVNDDWQPQSACGYRSYRLQVFDRWGRQVFASEVPGQPWTGSNARGQPLPGGVYTFVLTYGFPFDNRRRQEAGLVQLLR